MTTLTRLSIAIVSLAAVAAVATGQNSKLLPDGTWLVASRQIDPTGPGKTTASAPGKTPTTDAVAAAPAGQAATPLEALARMPVREVTVFKDGHAFLLHQGKMPVDASGNVVMDYLPAPVLGTFWPFSAEKDGKLSAVVAGQRKVAVDRTALSVRDLIEANVGASVVITEVPAGREDKPLAYPATIVSIPTQSGQELEATSPPGGGPRLPIKGNVVVLKTAEGQKVVDFGRIMDVTFRGDIGKSKLANEEFRNLLTLKLNWDGKAPQTADVGLMYLQKGMRWIPEYKLNLDGKGNATVKFQATLVNELVDLEDATCNLVVGVPTFAFKDMTDPISLQQMITAVARQAYDFDNNRLSNLSNAIMTQAVAPPVASPGGGGGAMDLGPEIGGSSQNEDLFVFTVKHVTLKKGQRMVLAVSEMTLPYEDIYALNIPFAPPPELRANVGTEQQREVAKLLAAPKVMHKLRLTNNTKTPLTTAPILIMNDSKPLAQGMMTYTSAGGKVDLDITVAVDIKAKRTDKETARTPNAVNWQGNAYGRIDLTGTISLTNFRKEAAKVEVTRSVLGNVDKADHDGKTEMLNVFDEEGAAGPVPYWWNWYSWPNWWYHFNGMGKVTWEVTLEPGKSVDLGYTWNYYWR